MDLSPPFLFSSLSRGGGGKNCRRVHPSFQEIGSRLDIEVKKIGKRFVQSNLIRGSSNEWCIVSFLFFFFQLEGRRSCEGWSRMTIKLLSNYRWNGPSSPRNCGKHSGGAERDEGGGGLEVKESCRAAHELLLYVHTRVQWRCPPSRRTEREREREGYRWTQAPCVPRTSLRTSNKTSRRRRLSTG